MVKNFLLLVVMFSITPAFGKEHQRISCVLPTIYTNKQPRIPRKTYDELVKTGWKPTEPIEVVDPPSNGETRPEDLPCFTVYPDNWKKAKPASQQKRQSNQVSHNSSQTKNSRNTK